MPIHILQNKEYNKNIQHTLTKHILLQLDGKISIIPNALYRRGANRNERGGCQHTGTNQNFVRVRVISYSPFPFRQ